MVSVLYLNDFTYGYGSSNKLVISVFNFLKSLIYNNQKYDGDIF
jgi:hypothetical protein